MSFALATAGQSAPNNASWSVAWKHYSDSTCTTEDGSGTASYTGNTLSSGSQPAVGNKQWTKATAVSMPGYALDYWSNSATGTTPLTDAQLCAAGPDQTTLYAHFKSAIHTTSLNAASAAGTYGGTANVSATLTSSGSGVSGKSIAFKLNGATVGTATTNGTGVASLAAASLQGIKAGTYVGGVTASFDGDSGYASSAATNALTVGQRAVTGSFTVASKVYDGTADAIISGRSLAGVVGTDDVSLAGGIAQFDTKNVGQSKSVTGTGFVLGGADKGDYTLASGTVASTASITAKELTGSFSAADKVYDGNRDATITGRSPAGVVGSEDVGRTGGSAQFDTKNVAAGKTVTASGFGLGGADKANYTLKSDTLTTTATITAKQLTGSFTAADKTYDGNRDATITGRSLSGVVGTETVSLTGGTAQFDSKTTGANKTVTGAGFSLAGDDKDNYTLGAVSDTKASIIVKEITGSFTAADKVYDGNRDATITGESLGSGVVDGEEVTLDASAAKAQFDGKDAGANKTVTGSGFALAGADAGNYTLSMRTASASIAPKSITGSFKAADKVYDGNRDATITDTAVVSGVIAGDQVSLDASAAKAQFGTKDAGQSKMVTGSGFTLVGPDAGDYALGGVSGATASITPKSIAGSFTAADKIYDGTVAGRSPAARSPARSPGTTSTSPVARRRSRRRRSARARR